MNDFAQDLIHIAVGHLLPANPAKYAWVSAVEEGPYHIETNDSAANGGQGFKAICGAAGDFLFHLTAAQIFPSQKCKSCVELASTKVLEVAPKGVAGVSGSTDGRADEGQARFAKSQSGSSTTPEMAGSRSVTFGRGILRDSVVTCHTYDNAAQTEQVSTQASPADSQVSKVAHHGKGQPSIGSLCVGKGGEGPAKTSPLPYDFTDNILRYMEGIGR